MNFSTLEKRKPSIDKNNGIGLKERIKNKLYPVLIWGNSLMPMASTTTSTVNTIGVPIATTITLGTATSLLTACGGEEDGPDRVDTKDTTPPTINVNRSEVDITGGKEIRISGNQLYIGDILVASRSDDKTKNCKVSLSINGKTITSGTTISEEGTLTIKVSDDAGNVKSNDIKLNMTKNAPSITVNQYEVNIFGGTKININNNQLLFGDEVIASRNDDNLESCKVLLNFNGKDIKSGDTINEEGTLIISITNNKGITSTAEITVKNESIYGIENLKNATIQVDKEINLLNGISFADGVELIKTEIEKDGKRNTISDPYHYIPSYPGTINIIFTVKGKNGNTAEIKVDNLTIKPLDFKSIEIKNLQPKEILPIVGQINVGDKNTYEYIEPLRIAESTLIRDMMWKYGAGNYSPEEYQQLMLRLNTGIIGEKPQGFNNFELVGKDLHNESEHGHDTRDILNSIIKHANLKVLQDYGNAMDEFYQNQPENSINIFATSGSSEYSSKEDYDNGNFDYTNLRKYTNKDNFLRFVSGSNLITKKGIFKNKICQENNNLPDEHSIYSVPQSGANSKNDANISKHIFITVGTNKQGNVDISNTNSGSKFPIGFHPDVIFSGRAFPFNTLEGNVYGEDGNYRTSYTNFTNLSMGDICFQMKADIPNTPQLMSMILNTSLNNQIHLDGQTQNLHLINPAGFIKEYLMPTVPSSINEGKTITLEKGFYKGIIFDIPGAEVNINGEWIAYNKENQSLIKSQNPFNLKWRLNGDLCKKMGYNQNNPIKGKIIISDDKFNGLNISKDIQINIK